jgi:hypothetical protein
MIKMEHKYRKTLLLNPCNEIEEINDTDEEYKETLKNISKELIIQYSN